MKNDNGRDMPWHVPTPLSKTTKNLLSKHNIHLKKSLGQNMLIDRPAIERIIAAADISKEDTVIEIGTGTGILTKELAKKAKSVISYEKDPRILEAAKDYLSDTDNVKLINEDFLDVATCHGMSLQKVVANLPYYITSPIIEKIFENIKCKDPDSIGVSTVILTVQREFAKRIIAGPGTKEYGSFTVFVNYYAEPEIISYIPKSSFIPQPDVSSAIIRLKIRKDPPVRIKDEAVFFAVVRAAFSQRRKTLKNSLSSKFDIGGIEKALSISGIDPKRRAETLSISEFAKITDSYSDL